MKSMRQFLFVAILFLTYFTADVQAQISGTFPIAGGVGNRLSDFYNTVLLPNGINGNTILELADGYNESELIRIRNYPGNDQYTLTIRPAAGASSCVISDNGSNDMTISFEDARNVILDGRPGGTGNENVLTIIQNQRGFEAGIQFCWGSGPAYQDTSYNITIRNCNLRSDGYSGILVYLADNLIIENCDFSTNTTSGISSSNVYNGIYLMGASRSTIRSNRFHDLRPANDGTAMVGINIYGADHNSGNTLIYNNYISLDASAQDSVAKLYGIWSNWSSPDPCEIYFNTIYIGGYENAYTYSRDSYGIAHRGSGSLVVKNNLIANQRRGLYYHYAVYFEDITGSHEINNNNYYVSSEVGRIGYWGTSPASSLALWRALSSQDANTTDKPLSFVDPGQNDLHLSGPSFVDSDLHGVAISGITTDYDGETRDAVNPFKGADEPNADLMLVSPNGGEIWGQGESKTITWSDQLSENVRIELYKNGVLNRTIISSTASDGSHIWAIPTTQATGTDYKIRIISTTNGTIQDDSDQNFSIRDITAPAAPISLTAGGAAPSPWQNTATFSLNWTNPTDYSGINRVKYKIGSAPTSNTDSTGSLSATPPQNFSVTQEGSTTIYMWLVDNSGNENYSNYASVTMRFDETINSPTNFAESHGVINNTWQNSVANPTFTWIAPSDLSGILRYQIYFGPNPSGSVPTDSTSGTSFTATNAPQGTSYLRVRTKDNAGNIGNWTPGFTFRYDNTAPANPTTFTETGGVQNDVWQSTVADPAFTWNGVTDTHSGLAGYTVYWGNNPEGVPATDVVTESFDASAAANGVSYLRIKTRDNAGNESIVETKFIFKHDNIAPVNPGNFADAGGTQNNVWQNNNNDPAFTWNAGSDPLSGIAGYEYYWGPDPAGTSGNLTAETSFNPSAADTGSTYLRIRARDNVGNTASWFTAYIFKFDDIPPVVEASSPDTSAGESFLVSWGHGQDTGGSGLTGIFNVRVSEDAANWTDWHQDYAGNSDTFAGEQGKTYYFEATAIDSAQNNESFNGVAECSTVVDTTVSDTIAPGIPETLTAGGVSGISPWQNNAVFEVQWTNPSSESSGIAKAHYKLGSVPNGSGDITGTIPAPAGSSPIANITATAQGGQNLHIWLEDTRGNVDYNNYATVELRWDATRPTGTIANSKGRTHIPTFTVSWGGGQDTWSGLSGKYDINVKTNDGEWLRWLTAYAGTSRDTTGNQLDIMYFEAAAYDKAGNTELFTGTAECSTLIDTTVIDTVAPDNPINLTAGGMTESSPWQNSKTFEVQWINPQDLSDIVRAYYKLGSGPLSNDDTTGSMPVTGSSPTVTISVTEEGGQDVYIWLEDGEGNVDYENNSAVELRWDFTLPQDAIAFSPLMSKETSFLVRWSQGDDSYSGISGQYDVNIRINNGSWSRWLTAVEDTSQIYTDGSHGSTYYFEARSYDNAGNTEQFIGVAECYTVVDTVGDSIAPGPPQDLMAVPSGWSNNNTFDLSWSNPEPDENIGGAWYKLGSAPASAGDGIFIADVQIGITGIAIDSAGIHEVYVWLQDLAGNTNYTSYAQTMFYYDNVIPIVDHTPVTSATPGSAITINATVSDTLSGIAKVDLLYRITGDTGIPLKVDLTSGTAEIPSETNTKIGLEYVLIATDNAGNTQRKPESGNYIIQANISDRVYNTSATGQEILQHRGTLATDYRIFSIPYVLQNGRVADVFEDDLDTYDDTKWKLFDIAGNNLVSYTTIKDQNIVKPGKAFLLIVNLPNAYIDAEQAKSPRAADYTTLPLTSGWNLVGNPFDFDIPLDSLTVDGEQPEAWYTGSSGWTKSVNTFRKWEGLAIWAAQNTNLHIGVGSGVGMNKLYADQIAEDEWQIKITASAEQSMDIDNYIGVYSGHSGHLRSIWHEPPRMGNAVSLTVAQPTDHTDDNVDKSKYSTILKEKNPHGYIWDINLRGDIAGEKVTMNLEQLAELPAEYEIKLIDMDLHTTYDITNKYWEVLLNMGSKKERTYRIVIGTEQYVSEQLTELPLIPATCELKQNYPNPFNMSTILQFGVPEALDVYLDVYNILGQKVRTLLNGQKYQAGYHVMEWDGRNDVSRSVATGVYIFRFRAGPEVRIIKGILAK